MRRAATFLRKIGIEIGFEREGRARTRIDPHHHDRATAAPESAGAQTVRIVRTVRANAEIQFGNGFAHPTCGRSAIDADGSSGRERPQPSAPTP